MNVVASAAGAGADAVVDDDGNGSDVAKMSTGSLIQTYRTQPLEFSSPMFQW